MNLNRSSAGKTVHIFLIVAVLLASYGVNPSTDVLAGATTTATAPPPTAAAPVTPAGAAPSPTATRRVIRVTRTSGATSSSSRITVRVITPTPTPTLAATPAVSETLDSDVDMQALPTILQGLAGRKPCGFADIVAFDGHALRAEPMLAWPAGNTVEELAEGTRVDLIDCRLWTDMDDLTWVAVQTEVGKLGWILIQPDAVYVTILPIAHEVVPPVLTGIPAGAKRAYAPPSECPDGDRSTEGTATSIGIDLIPVVGDVKGLSEAATGCDLVTGEPLGDWRWFGLLGVIGLSEVALLRHADDAADVARMAGNADDVVSAAGRNVDEAAGLAGRNADEAAGLAGRNADTAGDLAKTAGKIDGVTDEGIDAAKLVENGSSSVEEAALLAAKFEQPCSFSAGTPVLTDAGPVPINLIEPGDRVLAYHEGLASTGYFTVTNRFAHLDPVIVDIEVGGERLQTTPEHPFYVDNRWVAARDLQVGDRIASSDEGSAPIGRIEMIQRPEVMWNLTVSEAHTYFVGDEELLVHNACARALRKNMNGQLEPWTKEVEWQAHHVIPGKFEDHPFLQRAKSAGWDIDDASNGVSLPIVPSFDSSGQWIQRPLSKQLGDSTVNDLGRQLDDFEQIAAKQQWTDARAKYELEQLVRTQRQNILALPTTRPQPKKAYISAQRRTHILHGDATGGGHLWPGKDGKTSFPEDWSAQKILESVEDIGTSSNTQWYAKPGQEGLIAKNGRPSRWDAWEVRDGVQIHVVYEPANGNIITAFPDRKGPVGEKVNRP